MTITAPGSYTLTSDQVSTGMFNIAIQSNDVVLNLNGYTVRAAPSNPATAVTFGIHCADQQRITIRNGAVTGAFFGVHGGYGSQILIEDVDFSGNTYIGANLGYGAGNIVRRCQFRDIRGYTVEAYAVGINGMGINGLIESCEFRDLYKQPNATGVGEGVGVLMEATAANAVIRQNTFTNAVLAPNTIGIWGGGGSVVGVASGNAFTRITSPMVGAITDGGGNVMDDAGPPPDPPNQKAFRITVDSVTYEGSLPVVG